MKRLHVIIIDNETGETLRDVHTDAIVGAIDEGENVTGFCTAQCDPYTMAAVLECAEDTVHRQLKEHPELRRLVKQANRKNKIIATETN